MKNSGRMCKGICLKYRAKKPIGIGRYASGQKRCQICTIYLEYDSNKCPCCNYRLRCKPRNSAYKKKYDDAKNSEKLKRQIGKTTETKKRMTEAKKYYGTAQVNKQSKRARINKDSKTYVEAKEIIASGIDKRSNHQIVILKELLEYEELHKGEIAESLAYFNNKDPSNVNVIKYYIKSKAYDNLLKHKLIRQTSKDDKFPVFSSNISLEPFQKMELISYLTDAITRYNTERNIPENEIPTANNIRNINWLDSVIRDMF